MRTINFSACLLGALCLLLFSCQKDKEMSEPNEAEFNIPNISVPTQIIDGRLTFNSHEDMLEYKNQLQEIAYSSEDADAVFAHYEQGYRSLRSVEEAKPMPTNTGRLKTLEIEDGNFIKDDVKLSMLNEHNELGIDDRVAVYMGPNQVFMVSCPEDVERLQTVEKGQDLTAAMDYFTPNMELVTKESGDITNTIVSYSDGEKIELERDECGRGVWIVNDVYDYAFPTGFDNVNCEVFDKVIMGGLDETRTTYDAEGNIHIDTNDYIGDFTVDYGDGTTDSFNGVSEFEVTKTYSSAGTYTITVSVSFYNNETYQMDYLFTSHVIVVGEACTDEDVGKEQWFFDYDNNRAMEANIWFDCKWWGSQAGAKTTGYKNIGNVDKEKGNIFVRINADFLNDNCSSVNYKWDSKDCNSCKSKQVTESDWFTRRDIANGSINSEHEYKDNGAHFIEELVLNPCQ